MRFIARLRSGELVVCLLLLVACQQAPATAPEPQAEAEQQPVSQEEAPAEAQATEPAEAAAAQDGREPVNIYLVAHGACAWDAFWCVVEQGNKDAARDLGVNLTILSPPEFDPERTAQDIDKALAANPDGLGVTVTDGVLYEEPMLRAIDSGVPVIAYNAADWRPAEERIPYLTYIGQDEYEIHSPQDARALGIETVYQDLALVDSMSIGRNFFLGREPVRRVGPFRFLDIETVARETRASLADIGIKIRSAHEKVGKLSGGERQSIAIGRAVHFGARLLILYEPTSALSVGESRKVLEYTRNAKASGLSVIFITHNVHHVMEVADRYTIIRHGKNIGTYEKGELTADDIFNLITGERIS